MKEYDQALETYQEGLKHDPQNQELLDGVRRYGTLSTKLLANGLVLDSLFLCAS